MQLRQDIMAVSAIYKGSLNDIAATYKVFKRIGMIRDRTSFETDLPPVEDGIKRPDRLSAKESRVCRIDCSTNPRRNFGGLKA